MSSMVMGFLLLPQLEVLQNQAVQAEKGRPEGGTRGGVWLRSTFLPVPGTGPAVPTGSAPGAQAHGIPFDPGLFSCVSFLWQPLSSWTISGAEGFTLL